MTHEEMQQRTDRDCYRAIMTILHIVKAVIVGKFAQKTQNDRMEDDLVNNVVHFFFFLA